MSCCLGIEIGGTKLQIGLGHGTSAELLHLWRGEINAGEGAAAIRTLIEQQIPQVLAAGGVSRSDVAGIGVAFGGPVDAALGRTVISHQVEGWADFDLVGWLAEETGFRVALQNDADSAALAEARFGAGRGFDPVVYVTVGSGIGGGLVISGKIFRGGGAGAMEIGHLRPGSLPRHVPLGGETVEHIGSGFGITARAQQSIKNYFDTADYVQSQFATTQPQQSAQQFDAGRQRFAKLWELARENPQNITTRLIGEAARLGDPLSVGLLADATHTIGWALAQAVTLINPARIVIGGGVSLLGEDLFFAPVRRACREFTFGPFAGLAEIVPAGLGEEVVVYGAVAVAAAEFLESGGSANTATD